MSARLATAGTVTVAATVFVEVAGRVEVMVMVLALHFDEARASSPARKKRLDRRDYCLTIDVPSAWTPTQTAAMVASTATNL